MNHYELFTNAMEAGRIAADAHTPTPMTIRGYAPIADGVCGFAWVNIPGRGNFAKWIRENKHGHKAYHGGVDIWIADYNQSMEKKYAHAVAMAEYLRANGIPGAVAGNRMD